MSQYNCQVAYTDMAHGIFYLCDIIRLFVNTDLTNGVAFFSVNHNNVLCMRCSALNRRHEFQPTELTHA